MLRQFTQTVGRFRAGDIKDFPRSVWADIARSAKKEDPDKFSRLLPPGVTLRELENEKAPQTQTHTGGQGNAQSGAAVRGDVSRPRLDQGQQRK